jgi:hypothetical protein
MALLALLAFLGLLEGLLKFVENFFLVAFHVFLVFSNSVELISVAPCLTGFIPVLGIENGDITRLANVFIVYLSSIVKVVITVCGIIVFINRSRVKIDSSCRNLTSARLDA